MDTLRFRPFRYGLLCLLVFALTSAQAAFAIVVTNTLDSGAGSLRQAIITSNAGAGDGTITFSVSGTITLTSKELLISRSVTIFGPGAGVLTVQRSFAPGTPAFRIFNITAGSVAISGLTISNGLVVGGTGSDGAPGYMFHSPYAGGVGGIGGAALGGGILNSGTLTLDGCNLIGNSVVGGAGGVGGTGGIAEPGGPGGAGGTGGAGIGGAIYNAASLTLNDCVLNSNTARGGAGGMGGYGGDGPPEDAQINNSGGNGGFGGYGGNGLGGGVHNVGSLNARNCVFSNDLAPGGQGGQGGNGGNAGGGSSLGNGGNAGYGGTGGFGSGGGLYDSPTSTNVSVTNCSFSGNGALGGSGGVAGAFGSGFDNGADGNPGVVGVGEGGAISEYGAGSNIVSSTLTVNTATYGGAVYVNPNSNNIIWNSTIAFNTARLEGGGWYNAGNLTINYCTVARNVASDPVASSGGGIRSLVATCNLFDTILASNSATIARDCSGTIGNSDYNLIGNYNGFTVTGRNNNTILNKNPLLGPLQNNGGPTQTMALLPGSPAIDAGSNSGNLLGDQRGLSRVVDIPGIPNVYDACDIGAYELRPSDHSDFNGDSFPDLVLQNSTARQVAFWFTNGPNITGGAYALSGPNPIPLPPNWQVVATGDFNGDGTPDLVLENSSTGQIAFWFTSGNTITAGAYATSGGSNIGVPAGWQIVGAGDFNGDGKPDLVLQNPSSQTAAIWTMNGTNVTSGAYVTIGGSPINLPPGWQIVGAGDINGDGQPDLVLDNPSNGQIAMWVINGSNVASGSYLTYGGNPFLLPAGWQIAGIGDYNGDGQTDLALQNLGNRQLAFWYLSGTSLIGSSYALTGGSPIALPAGWQVAGPR